MINKLLYITTYSASSEVEKLRKLTGQNPGYAIQKFSRLLSEGFIKNGVEVSTISILAVSRKNCKKLFWSTKKCEENGVNFLHAPFINFPFIRQIGLFLYTIVKVFFWCISNKKEKVVFCDALTRSACLGAIYTCRFMGVKCVGIVTDMPGMVTKKIGNKFIQDLTDRINKGFITDFDACVFMTKYVNDVLNKKDKPYIILEGSVDVQMKNSDVEDLPKNNTRDIVYAGCIHERHGLKLLVEAFMRLPQKDIRLVLFGDGPFCEKLDAYISQDPRIIYKGVVPNNEVVDAELRATLLINPRPTHEPFVYYSFPSKNLEYMATGTPVVTTKLPCFPEEYDPYLYYMEDVSVAGFYSSLNAILSLGTEELKEKGRSCKEFVLEKKNNVIQSKRILDLINSL